MPLIPVPEGKSSIRRSADGLEIVVPPRRHVFLLGFLSFWLIGWALGEISTIKELIAPSAKGPGGPFLFVWISAWTVGGAFALCAWVWMVAGRERITLRPNVLTLRREVCGYGRDRDFDLAHVRALRVAPSPFSPFDPSASFQFWGIGGGHIAFDYGSKTFRCAASLDEAEARQVVSMLSAAMERRPDSDSSTASSEAHMPGRSLSTPEHPA